MNKNIHLSGEKINMEIKKVKTKCTLIITSVTLLSILI